jgi:cobalamin biosynthesis protein CbiD
MHFAVPLKHFEIFHRMNINHHMHWLRKTSITMTITIAWTKTTEEPYSVTASVIKDAGDDLDVTDRAEICSTVFLTNDVGTISIDGGKGVGRVTKPGLG